MPASDRLHRTLRDLEWDQVTDKLATFAAGSMGAALCRETDLPTGMAEIRERIEETAEARAILQAAADVPLAGLTDVRGILARVGKAASLDASELLAMGGVLSASRRVKTALTRHRDRAPGLADMARPLVSMRELEKAIEQTFEPGGEVADRASPELAALRKQERNLHRTVVDRVQRMIGRSGFGDLLQEEIYTLRHGRYVVPVKIEHKAKVEGIVHDLSGSGQSIYIEPREITGLNNQLRTTELEIENEIRRIFAYLTSKIAARVDEIELSLGILGHIDFIFARARYAEFLHASLPRINREGRIRLRKVRHPLLLHQGQEVTPNDVEIGGEVSTLVITGPNMGGKTVTLKATGLCALMVRAGLHLPCAPDSEMAVFDGVYADIGDRQSIEENQSTFSARVMNQKHILEELSGASLVLLDEIGEGTDPHQGQALAQALLEALAARGAVTIATTHFNALTALAYSHKGFANASVEFDDRKLAPTYRLLAGVPGRSNALQIARRLQMDAAVIDRAKGLLNAEQSGMDDLLADLESERRRLRDAAGKAARLREEAEIARAEHEKILDRLQRRRSEMEEEMAREIKRDLSRAKAQIRDALQRVREGGRGVTPKVVSEAQADLSAVRKEIGERIDVQPAVDSSMAPIEDWSTVGEGDEVYVAPIHATGKVVVLPDARGRVTVQVRGSRLTLSADKLMRRSRPAGGSNSAGPVESPVAITQRPVVLDPEPVERTCDLRGMYREEALEKVEAFLDKAVRTRTAQVTIVHGHGTGVLKIAVREFLRSSGYVASFRPGKQGEGGDGATIVDVSV